MTPLKNLEKHLLGQEISHISKSPTGDNATLHLKNGVTLEIYESDYDCCAAAYGDWELHKPFHGGITNVEYDTETYNGEFGDHAEHCTITILHGNRALAIAHGTATDGNGGYYFSALSIQVRLHDTPTDDFEILHS